MGIYLYGEDGYTLSTLKNNLKELVNKINNNENLSNLTVFYRPSFGRGEFGFGEFDFIILGDNNIYLGESKWFEDNIKKVKIDIRTEQKNRHRILTDLINTQKNCLKNVLSVEQINLILSKHGKKTTDNLINSKLYANISKFLEFIIIRYSQCDKLPEIINVLLVFCRNEEIEIHSDSFFDKKIKRVYNSEYITI